MKRNFLLSLMVGLFLTGGLMAQDPPTGPPQNRNPQDFQQRRQQMLDDLKKELNLNKDQAAKFDAIYKESNEKMMAMRQQNAQGDREAMRAKMQEINKERDTKVEKLLTPEQLKKWKEYQAKQEALRQQRGQGGPGGPPGGERGIERY